MIISLARMMVSQGGSYGFTVPKHVVESLRMEKGRIYDIMINVPEDKLTLESIQEIARERHQTLNETKRLTE